MHAKKPKPSSDETSGPMMRFYLDAGSNGGLNERGDSTVLFHAATYVAKAREVDAEIARLKGELQEAENAYGVYEAKWQEAQAERDAWKRLADERDSALAIQGEHAIQLRTERDALYDMIVSYHSYAHSAALSACEAWLCRQLRERNALASMETGHE